MRGRETQALTQNESFRFKLIRAKYTEKIQHVTADKGSDVSTSQLSLSVPF